MTSNHGSSAYEPRRALSLRFRRRRHPAARAVVSDRRDRSPDHAAAERYGARLRRAHGLRFDEPRDVQDIRERRRRLRCGRDRRHRLRRRAARPARHPAGFGTAVRDLLRHPGLCVLSALHHPVRPRRRAANFDRLHAGGGGRDREHAQRPRPGVARTPEDGAGLSAGAYRHGFQDHLAVGRALSAHWHQACAGLCLHRRDRRRVHHVAHRHRLRDQLRLQQFRQQDHVSADPVDPRGLDRDQCGAVPLGADPDAKTRPVMIAKSWSAAVNSLILIAVLFAAWQLLFEFAGSQAMTAPVETFRYLAHLLTTATFWGHVEETSRAFFLALLLAVLLGLIIGFLLGVHRFSSEVFEPVLVAFYSIPKITLYPIILLAFGLGLP